MPSRWRFALVLALLAVGSPLCFGAAAAQALPPSVPSPLIAPELPVAALPLAAKAAAQSTAAAAKDNGGTSAIEAGENIGEILKGWGSALLLGIAGLMGLAALFKRNIGEGLTLLVVVVIVGGFIYAPDQVQGFIESVWSPIGG